VRLSPPITILAILTVAFGWLGLVNNITDCAYDPQGRLRWNHISEWFQSDDDQQPACDVWQGIEPRKPIGIIEINFGSAYLRIQPDGKASAILRRDWRDNLGYFETLEPPQWRESTQLRFAGYSVVDAQSTPAIYEQVRALVAPMRDYTAYVEPPRTLPDMVEGNELGPITDYTRNVIFDLDDPRTKLGVCSQQIYDSGAGWTIFYWDIRTRQFQSWSSYFDIGCRDPASRSGRDRARNAARLIMKVTGTTAQIEQRNENFFPTLP
jgi:hypothetical protein